MTVRVSVLFAPVTADRPERLVAPSRHQAQSRTIPLQIDTTMHGCARPPRAIRLDAAQPHPTGHQSVPPKPLDPDCGAPRSDSQNPSVLVVVPRPKGQLCSKPPTTVHQKPLIHRLPLLSQTLTLLFCWPSLPIERSPDNHHTSA